MPIPTTTEPFASTLVISDLLLGEIVEIPGYAPIKLAGTNKHAGILPFGSAVVIATGASDTHEDAGVFLPADNNSVFSGIALASPSIERVSGWSVDTNGVFGYPQNPVGSVIAAIHQPTILVAGVVGVRVRGTVSRGDQAFFIFTPDAGQSKGEFLNNANTSKAKAITNSMFLRSGVSGSIVPLAFRVQGF